MFDKTIDLADRISAVEDAVMAIQDQLTAFKTDIETLKSNADAVDVHLDAITGRIDADEKTVAAMGDALKSAAPDSVAGVSDDIAAIKARINEFHSEVYGAANPNVPFPVVTSTD